MPVDYGPFRFVQGYAPSALPQGEKYDAITLLAVLEHIPPRAQSHLATACLSLLNPRGRLVCTVPSPKVDALIHLGQRVGILEGMAAHEHYGFEPGDTVGLFTERGFVMRLHRRFQLGLNHLFVFARPDADSRSSSRS